MVVTPLLAVDGIVEIYDSKNKLKGLVLIERLNEPLGAALPGGFVDIGETVESALIREMKEEISLDVVIDRLFGVYSDPARDERGHCVSIVFVCRAYDSPVAADDAKDARIFSLDEIPYNDLVFDHDEIITDYVNSN